MRPAQSAIDAWNRFWFSPADPTLLGVVRILAGLMLLYTHAVWGLELDAFFGEKGWQSAELVHSLQREQLALSLWWWVPGGWIHVAHAAAMLVLLAFTVGLFTNVTSVLACIICISYANRAPAALFGLDQINSMLTLYLAIGGSGQALSLDRIPAQYRRIRSAVDAGSNLPDLEAPASGPHNLGLRLIQVHMCVIYLFAGLSKLQGTAWWNGEAMWLAFSNLEYQSTDMTWLAHFPWLIDLITHFTVLWEISFCVLIWIPALRPVVLAAAVALHVGIGATLGMWTFGLAMLIGRLSFLPPTLLHKLKQRIRPAGEPVHRIVRYTRDCIGCRREAILLKLFDLFDRVQLVEVERDALEHEEKDSTGRQNHRWNPVSHQHSYRSRTQLNAPGSPASNGESAALPVAEVEPAEVDSAGVEPAVVDRVDAAPDGSVALERHTGPLVVYIRRPSTQQQLLGDYLARRDYRVLNAENIELGIELVRKRSPDCVILVANHLELDEIVDFQNQVVELGDESTTSLVILASRQRDLLSSLRINRDERVLVRPVSLRDVRVEIESTLNCPNAVRSDSTGELHS